MTFSFKKHRILLFSAIVTAVLFLFFASFQKPDSVRYPWYETVSMYHVFVKSFYDSDGDGKGDLQGLTQKLDYIKELNVNTIYMLPITPALNNPAMPRSHYGYEIKDFKNIHPDYGTLEDFKTFVKEAHKRGLHVVLDFITTVISVRHPFFQDILNNPESPYKDWIITADEIPAGDWMNFNDYSEQFQSKAWKPLPHGGYYYSLWGDSPFLNYHNPEVRDYILSVIDFWLDMGADGFRMDATKHLFINGPGQEKQYHQPENFEFWRNLRRHITEKYGPEKTLIAEVVPIPTDIMYVEPDRTMFDSMFDSTFINDIYPYSETDLGLLYSAPYLHSFFDNPNTFKLTKLSQRVVYHSDHDGARLATRLKDPTPEKLKLAASILILTPAHVKIYAGDETGIKGFSDFSDFKNKWFHATVATMAWDDSKNGGFSTSDNPVVPVTDDYKQWNAEAEENSPDSLLNHYRALLKLKNTYPGLFFKAQRHSVPQADESIYAYLLNANGQTALAVMNLSGTPKAFSADFSIYAPEKIRPVFGNVLQTDASMKNGVVEIKDLPPYSTYVFLFGQFDASLLNPPAPETMQPADLAPDGQEKLSGAKTVYNAMLPEEGAVLRLFKGQGKVPVTAFSRHDGKYTKMFQDNPDTSAHDVFLPLIPSLTDAVIFSKDNIRFALEPRPAQNAFPGMTKLAESPENINLRSFSAAKDENYRYFKIEKTGYALQSNGGLDFALLINTKGAQGAPYWFSFWRLPAVLPRLAPDSVILYERHIKTGKVLTSINAMRPIGIQIPEKSFIFETPDAFWIIVSNRVLPEGALNIAPIVWSAGGSWGDKPPEGKEAPIIERLPFVASRKTYTSFRIDDYLRVP